MVSIREATIDDQVVVFNLLRQLMTSATEESPINQPSAVETYRQIIEEEKGTVLVAEEDGQILGVITLPINLGSGRPWDLGRDCANKKNHGPSGEPWMWAACSSL